MNEQKKKYTKIQKVAFSTEIGKMPPADIELEQAVLGAILIDKKAINIVVDIINTSTFYKSEHGNIFEAIIDLHNKGEAIDIRTIVNKLREKQTLESVGGAAYVSELTLRIQSSANIEYHARLLQQLKIKREVINLSMTMNMKGYDNSVDPFDLINESESFLNDLTSDIKSNTSFKVNDVLLDVLKKVEEASKNKTGVTGIPTGYVDLDAKTAGWQKGNLYVIAGASGMGKSVFSVTVGYKAANKGYSVGIISLEMPKELIIKRLISHDTLIDGDKLKSGKLSPDEWAALTTKTSQLANSNLYIDDESGIDVYKLINKAKNMKLKHGIDLLIFDYIQLCSGDKKSLNREQEIATISRNLKVLAKSLDIPIIALSQLNRDVDKRGNNVPKLSDIRESAAIVNDADAVIFIYRPEYYGIESDEEGNSSKGLAQLIFAKHRDGELGTINLKYVGNNSRFYDWNIFGDNNYSQYTPSNDLVDIEHKLYENIPDLPPNSLLGITGNMGFDDMLTL